MVGGLLLTTLHSLLYAQQRVITDRINYVMHPLIHLRFLTTSLYIHNPIIIFSWPLIVHFIVQSEVRVHHCLRRIIFSPSLFCLFSNIFAQNCPLLRLMMYWVVESSDTTTTVAGLRLYTTGCIFGV